MLQASRRTYRSRCQFRDDAQVGAPDAYQIRENNEHDQSSDYAAGGRCARVFHIATKLRSAAFP
jgi:hypothetical protein